MAATYKQFLAAPSSTLLADAATLHYVTTTTTFSGSSQIIKHLNTLQKQVAKKKEDVFNVIDGQNVVVLEVDTGLGFQTGGGPYLPGLDDNFLSARDVYLPITHIVTFDEAGKILQIRLQWDQGSLLKQVEVIGKSGRNWPIRDSQEQIAFIKGCVKSSGTAAPAASSHNEDLARNRSSSSNALRDPHASLKLFGPRDEIEAADPAPVVSPYAGNGPRQRTFTEILGDEPDSPSAARQQMSPSKAGQGKNFQPMRIFDGSEHAGEPEEPKSNGNRYIRPNPTKFSHFDFVDGLDPQNAPQPGIPFDEKPKSKHDSQWSFNDFSTPQKVKPSRTMRTQDVRHWDTEKDAVSETSEATHVKPRRDAEAHFELKDDAPAQRTQPSSETTADPKDGIHIAGDGMGGRKGTNRDWLYGESGDVAQPNPPRKAAYYTTAVGVSQEQNANIHIAGDGMGGRKGTDRDWLYNEEQTEAPKSVPGRKPGTSGVENDENRDTKIHIAGDGMGGRKGTDRDWLYGNVDEQPLPTRQKNNTTTGKKDFWDF